MMSVLNSVCIGRQYFKTVKTVRTEERNLSCWEGYLCVHGNKRAITPGRDTLCIQDCGSGLMLPLGPLIGQSRPRDYVLASHWSAVGKHLSQSISPSRSDKWEGIIQTSMLIVAPFEIYSLPVLKLL